METAIHVENLCRSFGDRQVVKGISFSVAKGEIFGFLGPNGAGKTTSIRMMIGELKAHGGNVEILGHTMPEERNTITDLIGVVLDHQNLYDRLTVRQNLDIFCALYEAGPDRVTEVLNLVHLSEHEKKAAQDLSRGLRQRTLIARGLLHHPQIIFLDEPTSALDPYSALVIRELVQTLRDQGATIFITTHYMEEANQLCDRIAIMHEGEIVAIDTPEALRMRYGRAVVTAMIRGSGEEVETRDFPLGDPEAAEQIAAFMKEDRIITLHSQEATLEEVFMNLTGNAWQANAPGNGTEGGS